MSQSQIRPTFPPRPAPVHVAGPLVRPAWSPWGAVDHCEHVADGVAFVSTASHGGYAVHRDLAAARIPACVRAYAARWVEASRGVVEWYEEDCAALAIPVYLGELTRSTLPDRVDYLRALRQWVPDAPTPADLAALDAFSA